MMFVYIWKDQNSTPFYVGLTSQFARTRPTHSHSRNKFCKQKLADIGYCNVVVEILTIESIQEAKEMEDSLIIKYGRLHDNTGTLTNINRGGAQHFKSPETKAKLSAIMNAPDKKTIWEGDNNPAKKSESREKLKSVWKDPTYREAQRQRKLGKPIHTEEEKSKRRLAMQDPNHPLNVKAFHTTLNSDPDIKAKRVAGLRTPENRARQSAQMKEYWANKRAMKDST